jgi:hypothetical protein
VDCLRSDDSELRGLPKPLWMLVILALPLFGGIFWIVLGRVPAPGSARPGAQRLRTNGPDDDPEFLRSLNPRRPRRRDDEGDPQA